MDNLCSYFFILSPTLLIYLTSAIFPISKTAGNNVPFRPPSYIFAIVWPILLILIGFSWNNRSNLSIEYYVLIILLSLWPVLYFYSNVLSLINIVITLIFTLFIIIYKYQNISSLLLVPLFLWLIFATYLNTYEVFLK
jgi:tryptophan-rich sensory protein